MVHTFTALGQYLAADVNSGAVHVLDKLTYDLLSQVEKEPGLGKTCPQSVARALPQYSAEQLAEALTGARWWFLRRRATARPSRWLWPRPRDSPSPTPPVACG